MDEQKFLTMDATLASLVKDVLPKLVGRIKGVEAIKDEVEGRHTAYRMENDARVASIEMSVSKLEEFTGFVAEYEGRIARLEGQLDAVLEAVRTCNERVDALVTATVEKPKRKRRTKAEIEADKAAAEQEKIEAEVPEVMDPTEPEIGVGLVPETISGVDITKSVIKCVLQDVKSCAGDWDAVAGVNQYGPDVVRYIQQMTPEVLKETVKRFPD